MPIVVVYSFHGCKLFYFLNISKFIHSPLDGHSGCFRFFAITNIDDVNILVPLSWYTYCRNFSRVYMPRNRIAEI